MAQKNSGADTEPLVSVCLTFLNAGRYIRRAIDSCLNQTYRNIEVVVVDDASTDDSETIVRGYAMRDPRISYYRNSVRTGLAESELTMFTKAKGKFSMMLGADDWIARDYVENGVRSFSEHPDVAGIIPQLLWWKESTDGTFSVVDDRFRFCVSPVVRPAEWFIKRVYRPGSWYISTFALVRSEDCARAMQFYIDNYCRNLPVSASDELKHYAKMAFGMDAVVFPEILTRHKNFVFDFSMRYMKIALPEGQANNLDFHHASTAEIFKEGWYQIRMFTALYKKKWPQFYSRMRVFKSAEILSTALIFFIRNRFHISFSMNTQESKRWREAFLESLSFLEVLVAIPYSIFLTLVRCIRFFVRKLVERWKCPTEASSLFVSENFLDSERRFNVT